MRVYRQYNRFLRLISSLNLEKFVKQAVLCAVTSLDSDQGFTIGKAPAVTDSPKLNTKSNLSQHPERTKVNPRAPMNVP